MEWINAIQGAVEFMEQHIAEDISADDIAAHVHISAYYFQRGFRMLCGYSVMEYVCGMFGINIDEKMGHDSFEYLIADLYDPKTEVPKGFLVRSIPAFTWAVFSCDGPLPAALEDVNMKIFSEWLPALKEYEFAAGYCVEMYDAPDQYPKGTQDEKYHSEIWIPVRKKSDHVR